VSPFRRLLGYVLPYRQAFVLGLVCVFVNRGVALAAPKVLGYAIDDLTRGVTWQKLILYGMVLLGIGVASGIFMFLARRIIVGASRHIEYDLRNGFFEHLEKLPAGYFQQHRTGDLMSRATNDLNAVRMMIGPAILYSASTLLVFVVALALMISIDARLTLVSLIPLPFVSLSVKYFGSAIHKRFEQIQAQLADVSAITQEALSGVRVVRAYRQEAAELERFRSANLEYLRRNRRLIAVQGFFFPSMSFFLGLGSMIVLWLGGRDVINGRITIGEFVAFNSYLVMLSWPMIAFGWVTNMLQRGMASWKRMIDVLDVVPAIRDVQPQTDGAPAVSTLGPATVLRGEIEFRNLSFSFNGSRVLNGVSAHIRAGQTVAFVGLTGSGKSTLISLLPRLHDPPPGTVFIDGMDVREIPLSVLRRAIGFVPQEPFLFSDKLADNVAFGLDVLRAGEVGAAGRAGDFRAPARAERPRPRRPEDEELRSEASASVRAGEEAPGRVESDERLRQIEYASAIARLDKDVVSFPKAYDTVVGERGITLSGGQKQRTALARAVAIDPRILILDDALSSVDTYTEEEILSQLRGVMRQRTSIIVSHRISTVRDADQVFVLERGEVVERGTHDQLLRRDGLYAELHRKQLLEEELEAS
jgi:ATP-binding cassette subfamily B protein